LASVFTIEPLLKTGGVMTSKPLSQWPHTQISRSLDRHEVKYKGKVILSHRQVPNNRAYITFIFPNGRHTKEVRKRINQYAVEFDIAFSIFTRGRDVFVQIPDGSEPMDAYRINPLLQGTYVCPYIKYPLLTHVEE
jgi:hypothetical protein